MPTQQHQQTMHRPQLCKCGTYQAEESRHGHIVEVLVGLTLRVHEYKRPELVSDVLRPRARTDGVGAYGEHFPTAFVTAIINQSVEVPVTAPDFVSGIALRGNSNVREH